MILRCLIVDDEPPAHKVIANYIEKIDHLQLAGNCYSAAEAINMLHSQEIHIMFLDIDMPDITGLEMLRSLQHTPDVILTTAYSQFALESFELGVVDYLLKPIRFERFLKSVNRIINKRLHRPTESPGFIYVKSDGMQVKVDFSKIHYIEAYGNYLKIHLADKVILAAEVMSEIMKKLPEKTFIRIHRSYIININHVEKLSGAMVFLPATELPVSASHRDALLKILGVK